MTPGAGPRQLVMHPNGKFAYLINELNSTMTAYRYDATKGTLDRAADPADAAGRTFTPTAAAPRCRSRRRENSSTARTAATTRIVIYAIDPTKGTLTLVGHESTRGRIPRNFEIHPGGEFLAAANQDTDNVVMFRIDQKTGKLTPTGNVVEAGTPICVRFM